MLHRLLAIFAVALSLVAPAFAQDNLNDFYIDFAVPDTPALGLFGMSPNKVARPGNLKELGIAVLPLSTVEAKIGSGIAVSWAPVYTFARSIDGYRSGVARRLTFSLATTKDSKSDAISVGVGVRVMLLDRSDPVLDDAFNKAVLEILTKSLKGPEQRNDFRNNQATPVLKDVVGLMTSDTLLQAELIGVLLDSWDIMAVPPATTAASQFIRFQRALNGQVNPALGIMRVDLAMNPKLKADVERIAQAYVDAEVPPPVASKAKLAATRQLFLQKNWNAPVAAIDIGQLSVSPNGTWGDLQARQFGSAFLAALPAGASGQLVVQAQGRKGFGDDPDEDWFYSGGGRLLLGSATKRLSIEGLLSKIRSADAATNGVTKRLTIGTEFRVTQGFWLEIAFGNEWTPVTATKGTSLVSLASLKYAFKTRPRFTQIPGVNEEE